MTKHMIEPTVCEVALTGSDNYFTLMNHDGLGLYPDNDLYVVNMWVTQFEHMLDNNIFDNGVVEVLLIHENFIWISDKRIPSEYKHDSYPCTTGCGSGYTSDRAKEIARTIDVIFNDQKQTSTFIKLIKSLLNEKESGIIFKTETLNEIIYEHVIGDEICIVSLLNMHDHIQISLVVGLQGTTPVRINSNRSRIGYLLGYDGLHRIDGILFDLLEFSQHAVSSEFNFDYVKSHINKKYI